MKPPKVVELAEGIAHNLVCALVKDDTCMSTGRTCSVRTEARQFTESTAKYNLGGCIQKPCSPLHSLVKGFFQSAEFCSYVRQYRSGCRADSLKRIWRSKSVERSKARTSDQDLLPSLCVRGCCDATILTRRDWCTL